VLSLSLINKTLKKKREEGKNSDAS